MKVKQIFKGLFAAIKFSTKNFIRAIFLLVALAVFCGVSIWFFMIHYINANNVGEQIARQLESTLGRTVFISRVKFILPTTFILEDFKIIDSMAPDYKEMVSIKEVKLHFEIKPLLENKILVKEAVFENPIINIVKTPKGVLNIPEIHTKKKTKNKGTEFNFTTKEGTPWQVLIQDWVLQNGTFAFRNLASNQSHSLNGLNLRFYNLEFNEDTLFDLNFVLRNRIKQKVIEAETVANGKINFANFKPQEMALKDAELNFYPFKKPIQVKLNVNNFIEPQINLSLTSPQITDSEIAFLFDTKNKYSLPDTELSLSGEIKDNFNQINISSLSLKNKEIQLNANGNFNLENDIKGAFSVQNSKIDSSKIALYYKELKPFDLVGTVDVKGDFTFDKSALKTKKLTAKSNSLSSKIFDFTVQKAKVVFDATENFNKMKAVFDDGIFMVGKTKVTNIKGYTTLDYKKQDFYAIAESANLNGKPTRMSVGIKDVRQENKRKVKMLVSTSELNPLEIFDIVQDFVNALSDPDDKNDIPQDTSELSWLRNFRTALPKFMINFSGSVYAQNFTSPILSGKDFYATFNFTDLLPTMQKLNGNLETKLSNGIIYKLEEAAENQKALGIAYQPFVIMNRMERAGSFKMGKILKDTPFDIMSGSVTFKNGNMFVNNYYVDGSVISAAISGNVDWVKESFDLYIITMFKNISKRGALSENLTDESGDPALAFVTYGSMFKPKLEMKSPKKVGKQIQEARKKDKEQFEEIKKFKE
ncbi:MAG: AsmA family protein [Elusimicrobiaceae bacterium]|nr:AsmA family protein [Elusimicrobiaceae bacterium]